MKPGFVVQTQASFVKRMRSTLHYVGLTASGLSLGLFGCAPTADGVDTGGGSSLPAASNSTGGSSTSGGSSGGGANNTGSGAAAGGANVADRSQLVRPGSPTLFVTDPTIGVMSFAGANALNGNVAPTTFIDSFERFRSTSDLFPMTAHAVCVDRVGSLVVNDAAPSLRFYNNAATVTGIPAPDREIGGLGSRLADNRGIAYDRANDRLFVATGNRVLVFEGAKLAENGEVAPTRVFTSPDLPGGESIALGPNGDLYVADLLGQTVLVFANAGQRTGEVRADRVIDPPIIADVIAVDALDRLYVAFSDDITVLADASKLNGEVRDTPEMHLAGVAAIDETASAQTEIASLVVDSRGIGYVGDIANGAIHVVDNIASRVGDIRADRAITGPAVVFDRPFSIFLWE